MGGKTEQADYPASAARVYQCALVAAAESGWSVLQAQPDVGIITVNTGRSAWTWAGQDLTITVVPTGPANTRVIVGGSLAARGNPFGGGSQLIGWGEKGRLSRELLQNIARLLSQVPEPSAAATAIASPPAALPAGAAPPPPPAAVAAPAAPAGWYPDPSGRHQQRYWDGSRWTEHAYDGTQQLTDPLA